MLMCYLTVCNYCQKVLNDGNYDDESQINVQGYDFSMLRKDFELTQLGKDEYGHFEGCPECMTDSYLGDVTKHNLAISLYEGGYVDKRGFPVKQYNGEEFLSDFPNFHKSGSITGMKNKYYGRHALLVKKGDYIYNVTSDPKIYFNP